MSPVVVSDAVQKLMDWLREKKPEIGSIDPDDDLMNKRILDSLQFVNFLFMIEQVRGRPIPQEKVVPDNFTTLRSIEANFLGND